MRFPMRFPMRIVAALPVVLALLHTAPGGAVFPSGLPAAAQSAAEAETALALDRPSRRLIQQGLRNEGFDPGTPDGLFGAAHAGGHPGLAGGARGSRDRLSGWRAGRAAARRSSRGRRPGCCGRRSRTDGGTTSAIGLATERRTRPPVRHRHPSDATNGTRKRTSRRRRSRR